MSDETEILAKHAERRRAFLLTSAKTAPAVGLLLAQAAIPTEASAYGIVTASTTAIP